ncbi:MAG TPA: NADH-quinone oxidoreductase subunit C [Bryobacteraceae bacterium]|nr:NADH-quinone oxidoreductase subunit C [Bryobacteraceae bacterium]
MARRFPELAEMKQAFGGLVQSICAAHRNEVYLLTDGPDVRPIVQHLRSEYDARVAAVFAEDRCSAEGVYFNYYVFDQTGNPQFLIVQAPVSQEDARFPSLAAEIPAVNWQEREIQDWFGLVAEGHPNPRRVALHDNWPDVAPLRKSFAIDTVLPPFEGERHIYRPTLGEGVFQIPVGPIHAGVIEPGHFSFAVAGEPILYLQLRMFYVHKGIEKRFEQLPVNRAVYLAESISGDSSFSHGTAFCQAVEQAAEVEVPARARQMRTVLLELERVYNHVADIGAIATDVGFVIANAHASRLREMILCLNEELTGSRLLRGMICPGGVRWDWTSEQMDKCVEVLRVFAQEFGGLMRIIETSDSTRDRLERTGTLTPEKARDLGIVGVGGRASGVDRDARRDHPYAAYDPATLRVPVYQEGDVLRRMQVRVDEIWQSLELIAAAKAALAEPGSHRVPVSSIQPDRCALGVVEGWRGEILHWIRTGDDNRLERCKIKDPSLNNWPALVEAVQGNIVPDFPVINKSFNLSYSGTDR